MNEIYPVTIVMDRYGGTYSGGEWLAFNCNPEKLPSGFDEDDLSCDEFWRHNRLKIGVGSTPNDALLHLKVQFLSGN